MSTPPNPSPAPNPSPQPTDLSTSSLTIPSDSENYSANHELSSPPSSSSSPLILYSPPTIWGLLRGAAINLLLPFVNGLMLGFGELIANEIAFRLGWSGTKVYPSHRADSRPVGPGVEMRADPVERKRREGRELDMYTALE
ncbi:TOM13-domain-containing protein [Lojkania enalia]|uniref:TOM13-domain-containing protein n=1 Tax=Lojkania enalia TaxID=147567 RepID=A0A9P4NA64_9PLEO|nr:TOM13-domain-containing protein [Didymosphaeria enalia]